LPARQRGPRTGRSAACGLSWSVGCPPGPVVTQRGARLAAAGSRLARGPGRCMPASVTDREP